MIEKFREINRSFPQTSYVKEYKTSGKKVIGWLCTYVPEEIIHAAGALPIRITGYQQEQELDDGTAYLYVNNCSFSRSCLQLALRGEYDFLDGVVGGSTCDGVRRLFDLWRKYIGTNFNQILSIPRKFTQEAHELYLSQVTQFKQHLEEFMGAPITDEALTKSIDLYNKTRALLKELYDLRKSDNPPVTGAEVLEVLEAGFRMPKEAFNELLKKFLEELSKSNSATKGRARLAVVGSVLTNAEFIKSIEEQGGMVVTDELCTSTRYWSDPVVLDGNKSLLEAIAKRYLNNFPCARMYPSDERFDRIIQLIKDFRVDGVVSQIIRYCIPYAHDLPLLIKKLEKVDVPVLALDVEYGSSGSGQIATRVQAFLEMLEARE